MSANATQFASEGIYSADALEANRAGRLTDVQRRQFGAIDRAWRKNELVGAAVCTVMAAVLLTATGPAPNAALRPLAGAALLVVAVALALHAMPTQDPLAGDLHNGQVVTLEGAMEKHIFSTHSRGTSLPTCYLDVADKHFEVPRSEYDAAPQAGYVRVFYLPRSHKVVNLERLPDPPLPSGAVEAPTATVKQVLGELKSSRGADHRVAMAELIAMGNAVKAQQAALAVPPPLGERDPRPLAQAILGSWQAGPMAVSFVADGTMQATMPGGKVRQGRWHVDNDGHLHADAMGHDEAGEAWVVGDTLRVASSGTGLSFTRTH